MENAYKCMFFILNIELLTIMIYKNTIAVKLLYFCMYYF